MPGAAWASAPAPADTTAPAADGPQLGKMQILQTDKGAVLSLPVTGSADITSVTVTAAELGNPTQTYTFSLSLVSGAATDGTWQSTSPLGLPFGDYNFTGTAVDTNGRQITGSVYDSYDVYQPTIVFHGTTFSTNHLTIDSPTLEVKGEVTEYDPNTGDTGQPVAGARVEVTNDIPGNHGTPGAVVTGADGTFDITDHTVVDYGDLTQATYTVIGQGPVAPAPVTGPSELVEKDPALPTRILLDHPAEADLTAGSLVTISGTAQYQASDGTWHNLPSTYLSILHGSTWTGQATTDANGRFTTQARVPASGETWTVQTDNDTWYQEDPADFSFTVAQTVHLAVSSPSVNALDQLSFDLTATSTSGQFPGNRVYVQESPDGKTGWKTLGYLTVTKNVTGLHVTGPAGNPHGYWRVYFPAATDYPAAVSNVIHAFRYQTAFRGGKPNTTVIRAGHTLTFTGSLWQQGTGAWTPMHNSTVKLVFKPAGSSKWYVEGTARTSGTGAFTFRVTDRRNGTWAVVYTATDALHIDAVGPQTYVRVD